MAPVPTDAYVLLPPSESKSSGGERGVVGGRFTAELRTSHEQIRRELRVLMRSGDQVAQERILGVRGPLLERATTATKSLLAGRAPLLPAWQRYEGVVWSHLEPATLSDAQRARLLIPSGLYGLNAADDLIPDYRLTMKVSLGPVGNVANFWRPALTRSLSRLDRPIISLLPKEHESAIDSDALRAAGQYQSIQFVKADGEGAAGHDAKAVKGIVGGIVLRHGLRGLVGFSWRGWSSRVVDGELVIVAPSPF